VTTSIQTGNGKFEKRYVSVELEEHYVL